jgi:hypothetical protein
VTYDGKTPMGGHYGAYCRNGSEEGYRYTRYLDASAKANVQQMPIEYWDSYMVALQNTHFHSVADVPPKSAINPFAGISTVQPPIKQHIPPKQKMVHPSPIKTADTSKWITPVAMTVKFFIDTLYNWNF